MKRFYKEAAAGQAESGWQVLLDGRGIKTAGGRPQIVPTQAMARALAAEWAAQGDEIDPATFPLRDLADFAIDAVTPAPAQFVNELLPYAETDTLCYRADPEDALYKRQLEIWEPLLTAAETRLGARFTRISGIVHKPQPEEMLCKLRAELEALDPFTLAALRMLASLAASLTIGLEAIRPGAYAEALWNAAELETDWQVELWGEDWEATELRALRFKAFTLAITFAGLARGEKAPSTP